MLCWCLLARSLSHAATGSVAVWQCGSLVWQCAQVQTLSPSPRLHCHQLQLPSKTAINWHQNCRHQLTSLIISCHPSCCYQTAFISHQWSSLLCSAIRSRSMPTSSPAVISKTTIIGPLLAIISQQNCHHRYHQLPSLAIISHPKLPSKTDISSFSHQLIRA
jgi:hypothetical protein